MALASRSGESTRFEGTGFRGTGFEDMGLLPCEGKINQHIFFLIGPGDKIQSMATKHKMIS